MTEFKLRIEDTNGAVAEQTITNEKPYDDYTLQDDLDQYLQSYIVKFAEANYETGTEVKKLQLLLLQERLRKQVRKKKKEKSKTQRYRTKQK